MTGSRLDVSALEDLLTRLEAGPVPGDEVFAVFGRALPAPEGVAPDVLCRSLLLAEAFTGDEFVRFLSEAQGEEEVSSERVHAVALRRLRAREAISRTSGTSPTRTRRRSRADMERLRDVIYTVVSEDQPMSVRQCFYQLVTLGLVAKSESEYRSTVSRVLAEMRRAGELPYRWIADNSRWMRKPPSFDSVEDALRRTAESYRRRLWAASDVYVEVWLEKEALAGVLYEATAEWDVPLMVTRGYPSLTFLHEAGAAIAAHDKPTFLYYLGDHDPTGVDIPRKVEEELRGFAPDVEIHFERVAVSLAQIHEWGLPTRPTKRTDPRARGFAGASVEVDAIPPARLRELVEGVIARHVDRRELEVLRVAEASERELLERMAGRAS
jgi:hypothetical protein